MRTPRLHRVSLALALLLAGYATAVPAQRACTKIGCESGLAVAVEGTPPS